MGQSYNLTVVPDSLSLPFGKKNIFSSPQEIQTYLAQRVDSLHKMGYFSASIDSIKLTDFTYTAYAYLGNQIQFIQLKNGNIDSALFKKIVQKDQHSWQDVQAIKQSILDFYLAQAYINGEVYLEDFTINDNAFSASVFVQKGEKIEIDSIIVDGELQLSSTYLNRYFNIEKGDALTKAVLEKIKLRTTQSKLFSMVGQPRFRIKANHKADVYLQLEEQHGNQFDFIIGLQPNTTVSSGTKNLLITGEGQLKLLNPFGNGNEVAIDYKQLRPESPILHADLFVPILFGQRFGSRANFHIEKIDSSFVKVRYAGAVNYQFEGNKHISFGVEATNSFLQFVDVEYVLQTGLLPQTSDFKQTLYFSEFKNATLNAIFAPTKGIAYNLFAGVGNRTIEPEAKVLELEEETGINYQLYYDQLNENKFTLRAEADLSVFWPLATNSTILLRNQSKYQHFANYFINDLYRIGGIQSIRGFDEHSLLASAYTINTAEYRLLLNRKSFFSLFADVGYLKNKQNNSDDFLIGLGSGLDLSTKAGIFSVNLAVGKSKHLPFNIDRMRVHFGYVNVF